MGTTVSCRNAYDVRTTRSGDLPNLCELPQTISAPHSPGGLSIVRASRSVATTIFPPAALTLLATVDQSSIDPFHIRILH